MPDIRLLLRRVGSRPGSDRPICRSMEDGLHLADALDVAALRLVEAMQADEDEQVDERALTAVSSAASDSLERFWDWREHRPDHTIPDAVQQVFYCADVIAETLER